MSVDDNHSIGDRLRRIRHRRGLTQEALAERAGLSADLVRRLEQGRRHTARMSSLTALARALDVELPRLIAQPSTLSGRADEPGRVSVLAIRDAVTSLEDFPGFGVFGTAWSAEQAEAEPPSIPSLAQAVRQAETTRQQGAFTELGSTLPGLLVEARSATRAWEGDAQADAFGLLSEIYQIAATMMAALGKGDLGYLAMHRAQDAAARSGNELLQAANLAWLSWILFKQGRLGEAEDVAVATAERIEPDFVRGDPTHLAAWGVLLLRGASAAVRADRADRGEELLRLAQAAAVRVGTDRSVYATPLRRSDVRK